MGEGGGRRRGRLWGVGSGAFKRGAEMGRIFVGMRM